MPPADLVGDEARGHDRPGANEGAGALHHQELAGRALREQGDPADREHGHEMEEGEARKRDQRADDENGPIVSDQRNDGRRLEPPMFHKKRKLVGGDEPQPREQGHDVDGEGAEEGVAPAPIEEVGLRQVEQEEGKQGARDHEAERCAELRNRRVETAAPDRRVKREKRSEPIPRAAEGQPLSDPKQAEEVQRPGADLRIAWQERHGHGGKAEQKQRDRQLDATAMPAIDCHEDDRADRPGDEGEREHSEGVKRRRQRFRKREEHFWKHHNARR